MSDIISIVPVEPPLVPTLTDPAVNVKQLTPIEIAMALDKDGCTTTRKLYTWLELDETHYSRLAKVNILDNVYAEEGIDYSPMKASKNRGRGQFAQDDGSLIFFMREEYSPLRAKTPASFDCLISSTEGTGCVAWAGEKFGRRRLRCNVNFPSKTRTFMCLRSGKGAKNL